MGDTLNATETADVKDKPAHGNGDILFPPFPEPTQEDFEEDISIDEREYYKDKFTDLNTIKNSRLHCTACDRHLGCSARNESRMKIHPLLRTLICQTCLTFYNSGEFDKGDDGSELYCRWCGQGGQVYCCADCPHVFCAKCIKRNLGAGKIKEIEELDDWKCFKCNPKCIWDLRAICWAILRYCDLKNQITYKTQDPDLKEKYQKSCLQDSSECCKKKTKVKEKEPKKKDQEVLLKKASPLFSKIRPTIQVKKFASINIEDNAKEKKPQKRPLSPSPKSLQPRGLSIKNPIAILPKPTSTVNILNKRIKLCPTPPIRVTMGKKNSQTYGVSRQPRAKAPPMIYNGYNSNTYALTNDNINLSLESLTQGLDMSAAAVAAMSGCGVDDDVVCTPDFPMEPLCEVTEDTGDDDVECITPATPSLTPSTSGSVKCPPLLSRNVNILPELTPGNIIQMTDNDVTVNAATGGLKFRVDPQTLSSNKMYRLPDGRIFAINANPSMPGGYSATIVAVTDNVSKVPAKGTTFAAKLSAVISQPATPPKPNKVHTPPSRKNPKRNASTTSNNSTSTPQHSKATKSVEKRGTRPCDLAVPIEWYRYNLIDAIDALEYSLARLNQLKQQATTIFLRTRTVNEMRHLHKTLERLLSTSGNRFIEIKESLNKEFKNYVEKKQNNVVSDDDDDDVEILPDSNDDPIFIDENSMDSQDSPEVDLTGQGSSEHDSSGKSLDKAIESNIDIDDCVQMDSIPSKTFDGKHTADSDIDTLQDPLLLDDSKEDEPKDIEHISNDDKKEELMEKNDKSEKETTEEQERDNPKDEESESRVETSEAESSLISTLPLSVCLKEESESRVDTSEAESSLSSTLPLSVCLNEENASMDTDSNNIKKEKTDAKAGETEIGSNEVSEKEADDVEMSEATEDKEKSDNEREGKVSTEVDNDIETHEREMNDIEMSETIEEELSEKAIDENEMSEKAIEELLKDDNESVSSDIKSDSVNNHCTELSDEKLKS